MPRSEGTFGQAKHLLGVLSDADPTKAQFDGLVGRSDLLQILVKHGDSLKGVDRAVFENSLNPTPDSWLRMKQNPFASERQEPGGVEGDSGFFVRYGNHLTFAAASLERSLGYSFDHRHLDKIERLREDLPEGADGLVAWPKLAKIGEILGLPDPYDLDYGVCLRFVINQTVGARGLTIQDDCKGFNAVQLRPLACVANLYREWEAKVPGDYLYAPVQVGGLYAGYSIRNARWEMVHNRQFPLDPYVAACILLGNANFLYQKGTAIECPGATYARRPNERQEYVLTFENSNLSPTMYLFPESSVMPGIRPASGFLPSARKLKL